MLIAIFTKLLQIIDGNEKTIFKQKVSAFQKE